MDSNYVHWSIFLGIVLSLPGKSHDWSSTSEVIVTDVIKTHQHKLAAKHNKAWTVVIQEINHICDILSSIIFLLHKIG